MVGGNDGEGKTLRVLPSPWKSLRDSHIPTAPTTARLVSHNPRKEPSSAIPSGFLQAHPSIGKDCVYTPVLAKHSNPNRCHWPYRPLPGSYAETGFGEISSKTDFWPTITCGLPVNQELSCQNTLSLTN